MTSWVWGGGFLAGDFLGTLHRPTYRQPHALPMKHGWCWVDGLHFIFFLDSKEISHSHLPVSKEHQYFLNSSLNSSCFSPAWRMEPPALPTVEYYRERQYVSLRKEELRSVQQKGIALNRPPLLPVGKPALLQLQQQWR